MRDESRPAVFLDRDATLIEDRGFLRDPEQIELFADTAPALRTLQRHADMFIVTNQPGVAAGEVSLADVDMVNAALLARLACEGVWFISVYVCPHACADDCECIKPKAWFLTAPRASSASICAALSCVLAASVLTQACLGGIYAWSAFTPHLVSAHGITAAQSALIFGVAIAAFTVTMVFAGRIQDRQGPRLAAVGGALLFGCGYGLASDSGGSFAVLLVGIGVMAGAGTGFGYISALSSSVQWFPGHRGLVTGIAVAGFGGGAIALSSLGNALIGDGWTVLEVFRFVALFYGAILLAAALVLTTPRPIAEGAPAPRLRFAALRGDRAFQAAVAGIFSGTFGGLLVVGNLTPLGLASGVGPSAAVAAVGVFAAGNAAGRILWGWLYDSAGWRVIPLSLGTLAFALAGTLFATNAAAFVAASGLAGFAFGACFSLYAARVAAHFGQQNLGSVYPLVFLAYGFAGLTAPAAGGLIFDLTASYAPGLVAACALAAAGAVITYHLLRSDVTLSRTLPVCELEPAICTRLDVAS